MMINTRIRQVPDAREAAAADFPPTEPSHIHIPRPSRLRPSVVTQPDDESDTPLALAVRVAEAA